MNILHKLLGIKPQQAGQPLFPFQLHWWGGGFTILPANMLEYIRTGFGGNGTVYNIVKTQSDKFAAVPFRFYKKTDVQKANDYLRATKHYNPAAIRTKMAGMRELPDTDDLVRRINNPNDYQTESEFRKLAMIWLKITGMAPIYANRGLSGGKPLNISVLPPQWVTLKADSTLMRVAEATISPFGYAPDKELPLTDLYLWKYANPDFDTDGKHLYGQSPLKAALMDLKGSNEAKKAIAKMYENGGAHGMITPGQPINEAQAATWRHTIEAFLNGNVNKGKVGHLSQPANYTTVGLDAVDMKLIEGNKLTDERLALAYQHPPQLLQTDNKYDNQKEAIKQLVTHTIYSDLVSYRDMLNKWLIPLFGRTDVVADFDITELPEMQEDMEKLGNTAIALVNAGVINRNEARAVLKYDVSTQPEMDMFTVGGNVIPLADAALVNANFDDDSSADTGLAPQGATEV